ncbi:hypothetical protein DTO96_100448 [Ephemeroptericola cinctiostellae]|uniref:Glycosyltransferase 2-like domain-containing protein n=1 Tax=Ephemeroptericola cinctiostellae TaxID=2268024 RepID=A0A345D8Q0_9BURK|nr:glycosyltransferase family 92 protein [Ephemeroptericola cinctiostellae]AXF84738.1 hypothetical protein DTO96_100448 [Ephemeroptericola cinctiostellae]
MEIGITSIQRDRNPYIIEWIAFHLCVGFNRLYIYAHQSNDGMSQTLHDIAQHYPVYVKDIDASVSQHEAYTDSIHQYLPEVDWMAYIDGNDFLFPVQHANIKDALTLYEDKKLSALAVYWTCYGSSGHLTAPDGLLLEEYTRHSHPHFHTNRQIKSIVRGRQNGNVQNINAHYFSTSDGTCDENMRPLTPQGLANDELPSQNFFRINHYITQGTPLPHSSTQMPLNPPLNTAHSIEQLDNLDQNEYDDGIRYKFLNQLTLKIEEIKAHIGAIHPAL